MVLLLNEAARQVYIETSADLGAYSAALGSRAAADPAKRQCLRRYDNGFVTPSSGQATEVNLAGNIVYQLQEHKSISYRTYRMSNLYTPTEFENNFGMDGGLAPDGAFDFSGDSPRTRQHCSSTATPRFPGRPLS